MAHELAMGDDGILRMAFIGDVDEAAITAWISDMQPFLETAEKGKLKMLVDASRDGKMSSTARRTFTEVNRDPRLDKIAIVKISRFNRVMATFIMTATGRHNIRFFDEEAEALVWLNGKAEDSNRS